MQGSGDFFVAILSEDDEDDDETLSKAVGKPKKTKEQRGPRKRRRGKKDKELTPTAQASDLTVQSNEAVSVLGNENMTQQFYMQRQQQRQDWQEYSFNNVNRVESQLQGQGNRSGNHSRNGEYPSRNSKKEVGRGRMQFNQRFGLVEKSYSTTSDPQLKLNHRNRADTELSDCDLSMESEQSSIVSRSSFTSSMSDFASAMTSVIPALTNRYHSTATNEPMQAQLGPSGPPHNIPSASSSWLSNLSIGSHQTVASAAVDGMPYDGTADSPPDNSPMSLARMLKVGNYSGIDVVPETTSINNPFSARNWNAHAFAHQWLQPSPIPEAWPGVGSRENNGDNNLSISLDAMGLSPATEGSHGQWLQLQYEWFLTKYEYVEEYEFIAEEKERRKWSLWAVHAAEIERQRRMTVLKEIDEDQDRERRLRRKLASEMIEKERNERISQQFLSSLSSSHWFNETISAYSNDYELVCPYYTLGCRVHCLRSTLRQHLTDCEFCPETSAFHTDRANAFAGKIHSDLQSLGREFRQRVTNNLSQDEMEEFEVMCPNAILGCKFSANRKNVDRHLLEECQFRGSTTEQEAVEREMLKKLVIEECEEERTRRVQVGGNLIARRKQGAAKTRQDKLRPAVGAAGIVANANEIGCAAINSDDILSSGEDTADEFAPVEMPSRQMPGVEFTSVDPIEMESLRASFVHDILQSQHESVLSAIHKDIQAYWDANLLYQEQVSGPVVGAIVSELQACVLKLWPFATIEVFGSYKTGIVGNSGDVDLVVYFSDEFKQLLSVRGAIPLLHMLADHLERHGRNIIEIKNVLLHARIPLIKAKSRLTVPCRSGFNQVNMGMGKESEVMALSIDISIDGPMHSGVATTELVTTLMQALPPLGPLALVLKEYLKSRQLSDSFTGGLPSYGLILLLLLPVMHHSKGQQQAFPYNSVTLLRQALVDTTSAATIGTPQQSRRRHSEHTPTSGPIIGTPIANTSSAKPVSPRLSSRPVPFPLSSSPVTSSSLSKPPTPPTITVGTTSSCVTSDSLTPPVVGQYQRRRKSGEGTSIMGNNSNNRGLMLSPRTQTPRDLSQFSYPRSHVSVVKRSVANKIPTFSALLQQKEFGRKVALKLLFGEDSNVGSMKSGSFSIGMVKTSSTSGGSTVVTHEDTQHEAVSQSDELDPSERSQQLTDAIEDAATEVSGDLAAIPSFGWILETFLESYSEDLLEGKHGFSARDGGFRFDLGMKDPLVPAHPHAADPLLIEDPVNVINNVGKNCYKVAAVQKSFAEALERLKCMVVRHRTTQKSASQKGASDSVDYTTTLVVDDVLGLSQNMAMLDVDQSVDGNAFPLGAHDHSGSSTHNHPGNNAFALLQEVFEM